MSLPLKCFDDFMSMSLSCFYNDGILRNTNTFHIIGKRNSGKKNLIKKIVKTLNCGYQFKEIYLFTRNDYYEDYGNLFKDFCFNFCFVNNDIEPCEYVKRRMKTIIQKQKEEDSFKPILIICDDCEPELFSKELFESYLAFTEFNIYVINAYPVLSSVLQVDMIYL